MHSRNALGVANAILESAQEHGFSVTPMQLQKLLYFCNGWNLELRNQPLISDNFKAWQFGPVHPSVYHEFKKYGSGPIEGRSNNPFTNQPWEARLSDDEKSLIDEVVRIYGGLSGAQMSRLTHQEGTPWFQTWNGGLGKNDNIPAEVIQEEFKRLRNRGNAA